MFRVNLYSLSTIWLTFGYGPSGHQNIRMDGEGVMGAGEQMAQLTHDTPPLTTPLWFHRSIVLVQKTIYYGTEVRNSLHCTYIITGEEKQQEGCFLILPFKVSVICYPLVAANTLYFPLPPVKCRLRF